MGRNWQLKPTLEISCGGRRRHDQPRYGEVQAYSLLCGRLCTAPPEVAGDPQFNPSTAHQHLRR
jgi:hypothetical protein